MLDLAKYLYKVLDLRHNLSHNKLLKLLKVCDFMKCNDMIEYIYINYDCKKNRQ